MNRLPPHILQVSPSDSGGGAERVALDLHQEYVRRNLSAWHAVGRSTDPGPYCIPLSGDAYRSALTRLIVSRLPRPDSRGRLRVRQIGRAAAEPLRALSRMLGRDDYDYPTTRHLPALTDPAPDVLHLHNLHGSFFDLRALPALSAQLPTFVTLHDTWLMSGHCAYSLDCERWLTGCGSCPYPESPPAMLRDGSAHNWRAKRDIFRRSRLHVVGCSEWILKEAERSILAPAMASATLVRNGVDQRIFTPGDKREARARLGIPLAAHVVTFTANGVTNPYKDFATLLQALPDAVRALEPTPLLLVAIGAHRPIPGVDERSCRVVPFVEGRHEMATYLQAADLFVHATRADNYPLTILEAQSCGVPVLVTDVGGAPETIEPGVTGLTYPPGDVSDLVDALVALLNDPARLEQMGRAAAQRSRPRHSVERMADDYLRLYSATSPE